eukprot:182677-Prymnesium_polylepis.1
MAPAAVIPWARCAFARALVCVRVVRGRGMKFIGTRAHVHMWGLGSALPRSPADKAYRVALRRLVESGLDPRLDRAVALWRVQRVAPPMTAPLL